MSDHEPGEIRDRDRPRTSSTHRRRDIDRWRRPPANNKDSYIPKRARPHSGTGGNGGREMYTSGPHSANRESFYSAQSSRDPHPAHHQPSSSREAAQLHSLQNNYSTPHSTTSHMYRDNTTPRESIHSPSNHKDYSTMHTSTHRDPWGSITKREAPSIIPALHGRESWRTNRNEPEDYRPRTATYKDDMNSYRPRYYNEYPDPRSRRFSTQESDHGAEYTRRDDPYISKTRETSITSNHTEAISQDQGGRKAPERIDPSEVQHNSIPVTETKRQDDIAEDPLDSFDSEADTDIDVSMLTKPDTRQEAPIKSEKQMQHLFTEMSVQDLLGQSNTQASTSQAKQPLGMKQHDGYNDRIEIPPPQQGQKIAHTPSKAANIASSPPKSSLPVSRVQSPVQPSRVQPPVLPSRVQSPLQLSRVQSPTQPSEVQSPMQLSTVQSPTQTPRVQSPMEPLRMQSPIQTSRVQSHIQPLRVQSPVHASRTQSPLPPPQQQSPIKSKYHMQLPQAVPLSPTPLDVLPYTMKMAPEPVKFDLKDDAESAMLQPIPTYSEPMPKVQSVEPMSMSDQSYYIKNIERPTASHKTTSYEERPHDSGKKPRYDAPFDGRQSTTPPKPYHERLKPSLISDRSRTNSQSPLQHNRDEASSTSASETHGVRVPRQLSQQELFQASRTPPTGNSPPKLSVPIPPPARYPMPTPKIINNGPRNPNHDYKTVMQPRITTPYSSVTPIRTPHTARRMLSPPPPQHPFREHEISPPPPMRRARMVVAKPAQPIIELPEAAIEKDIDKEIPAVEVEELQKAEVVEDDISSASEVNDTDPPEAAEATDEISTTFKKLFDYDAPNTKEEVMVLMDQLDDDISKMETKIADGVAHSSPVQGTKGEENIIARILEENRSKRKRTKRPRTYTFDDIVELSITLETAPAFRPQLNAYLFQKRIQENEQVNQLRETFNTLETAWNTKITKWENQQMKKKSGKSGLVGSSSRGRITVEEYPACNFDPRTPLTPYLSEDYLSKWQDYAAEVPDMELSTPQYQDENAMWTGETKERFREKWTSQEEAIFLKRYLEHPKEFGKIANGLPNRTTSDAVLYYYTHKKMKNFKQALRLHNIAKTRTRKKSNTAIDPNDERGGLPLDIVGHNDVETAPQYVLQPLRSRVSSQVSEVESVVSEKPKTGSPPKKTPLWNVQEVLQFLQGFQTYGRDFDAVSSASKSTKTNLEIRTLFVAWKRKFNIDFSVREADLRNRVKGLCAGFALGPEGVPIPHRKSKSVQSKNKSRKKKGGGSAVLPDILKPEVTFSGNGEREAIKEIMDPLTAAEIMLDLKPELPPIMLPHPLPPMQTVEPKRTSIMSLLSVLDN